ncbi:hypothetical protein C8J56DRAFT_893384 [Mycena floridula]|nr:hypothetical protein C8J56DRAFT_893384 [Mycena floridula]
MSQFGIFAGKMDSEIGYFHNMVNLRRLTVQPQTIEESERLERALDIEREEKAAAWEMEMSRYRPTGVRRSRSLVFEQLELVKRPTGTDADEPRFPPEILSKVIGHLAEDYEGFVKILELNSLGRIVRDEAARFRYRTLRLEDDIDIDAISEIINANPSSTIPKFIKSLTIATNSSFHIVTTLLAKLTHVESLTLVLGRNVRNHIVVLAHYMDCLSRLPIEKFTISCHILEISGLICIMSQPSWSNLHHLSIHCDDLCMLSHVLDKPFAAEDAPVQRRSLQNLALSVGSPSYKSLEPDALKVLREVFETLPITQETLQTLAILYRPSSPMVKTVPTIEGMLECMANNITRLRLRVKDNEFDTAEDFLLDRNRFPNVSSLKLTMQIRCPEVYKKHLGFITAMEHFKLRLEVAGNPHFAGIRLPESWSILAKSDEMPVDRGWTLVPLFEWTDDWNIFGDRDGLGGHNVYVPASGDAVNALPILASFYPLPDSDGSDDPDGGPDEYEDFDFDFGIANEDIDL